MNPPALMTNAVSFQADVLAPEQVTLSPEGVAAVHLIINTPKGQYCIRPIGPEDNAAAGAIVADVLTEFGCGRPGFALHDPETKNLHGYFSQPEVYGAFYGVTFTPEATGTAEQAANIPEPAVIGVGGFGRLKGTTPAQGICELQKLYFYPQHRSAGIGKALYYLCILQAKAFGYHTMYLETVPQLTQAVTMYEKSGFQHLPGPLGNTGHTVCDIHMSLDLTQWQPSQLPESVRERLQPVLMTW